MTKKKANNAVSVYGEDIAFVMTCRPKKETRNLWHKGEGKSGPVQLGVIVDSVPELGEYTIVDDDLRVWDVTVIDPTCVIERRLAK